MQLLTTGAHVVVIILGFGLLIAVHELGHFLAARWAGIRVDAFAVGMGPVALAWRKGVGLRTGPTDRDIVKRLGQRTMELSDEELARHGIGETEYSLRWLPIGGFVKMVGQEDLNPSAASITQRSYGRCPIGKRMVVVSAGVIANLILAVGLFIVAFMIGVRVEAPVIGFVIPDSPAALAAALDERLGPEAAGIQPGDRVLSIDGRRVRAFPDVMIAAAMSRPGHTLHVAVERPGTVGPVEFMIEPQRDDFSGLRSIGVLPAAGNRLSTDREVATNVASFLARSAMESAGVRPGMDLVEVDGHPIVAWQQVEALLGAGRPVETVWADEEGRTIRAPLRPSALLPLRVPNADGELTEVAEGLLGLVPLTLVVGLTPNSPNVGLLQAGDVLLDVAGQPGPRAGQLRESLADLKGQSVRMRVRRGGPEGEVVEVNARVNRQGQIGILLGHASDVVELAQSVLRTIDADGQVSETPAAQLAPSRGGPGASGASGPAPHTRILAVDGTPVVDWFDLRQAILVATADANSSGDGASIALTVGPPLESSPTTVVMDLSAAEVQRLHGLPWRSEIDAVVFDPLATVLTAGGNPFRAVVMGFQETHQLVLLTYLTIDRLLRRSVGVDQLRGPVGIVHLGTRVVNRGWTYLIFFLAMISVNLAVLNFLPLPIVDGGLFLFLIYEKFKGQPPPIAFQNVATLIGLLLIGTLVVVTFYQDIVRLFTGSI